MPKLNPHEPEREIIAVGRCKNTAELNADIAEWKAWLDSLPEIAYPLPGGPSPVKDPIAYRLAQGPDFPLEEEEKEEST